VAGELHLPGDTQVNCQSLQSFTLSTVSNQLNLDFRAVG
jgi:hypothetical protein